MPESFIGELLDFGALGIFAGFLVWQHVGMQKRIDALVESFQGQIREIGESYEDRVDSVRARYDGLLLEYRTEHNDCLNSLSTKIDALSETIKELS